MATMKELMKYEGTEEAPFVIDEPFDPIELDYKTPFGVRWRSETITLSIKHIEALKNGKYIAVDVEKEYVIFLKLEDENEEKSTL
jgi:hypothetical protein